MDDVDRATELIENRLQDALAEVRRQPSLVACGVCHYCGEPIPQHHIFCSSECSVDHRHMTERRKANGL